MIYIYRYTCYITKHLHGVVAGGGIELLVDHAEVGPLQLLRHLGLHGHSFCCSGGGRSSSSRKLRLVVAGKITTANSSGGGGGGGGIDTFYGKNYIIP